MTALSETETVRRLVVLLATEEPFLHVRFGDGDVFFMTGTGPKLTADGEEWNEVLMNLLCDSWARIAMRAPRLLLGDLETYAVSDGCEPEWRDLLHELTERRARAGHHPAHLVHMEALRVGFGNALPFYQAVKVDQRRKVFVGPLRLAPVAKALGCGHVPVPLGTAWKSAPATVDVIDQLRPDLVLFAAGRGGKIMQGMLAEQTHITQVDVGSGLDLLVEDGVRRGTDLRVNRAAVLAEYRKAGLCD